MRCEGSLNILINIVTQVYKGKRMRYVSTLYKALGECSTHSTTYIKERWEKERNTEITDDEWQDMCGVQHATTNSGTWREFGWKNLMRYFITPKIKSKQGDNQGTCWRNCGTDEAHHSHVFWECGMLQPYWAAIHENISKILGYGIPKEFDVVYLGNLLCT